MTESFKARLRATPARGHTSTAVRRDAWRALAWLLPAAAIYVPFALWPLLHVLWLSLQQWNGYGPQRWTALNNFGDLWNDPQFHTALNHSLLWLLGAIIIPTAVGLALALVMGGTRLRGFALPVLFFPALLPPVAVAALWALVLSPLAGPLNVTLRAVRLGALAGNWLGDPHLALGSLFVAWLWSTLGITVLLFWTALTAIGREYVEIADIEGADPLWQLLHLTLPAIRRTGAIVAVLNAALAGQVFDLIWVTTGGGPGYATMTLPVDMYGRAFNGNTGEGSAVAVVQVAIGLVLAGVVLALSRGQTDGYQTSEPMATRTLRGPAGWGAYAATIGVVAVALAPLIWLIGSAVQPQTVFSLGTGGSALDPRSWTLTNLQTVWDNGMGDAIARSVLLAVLSVGLTVAVASPAAFALARLVRQRFVRACAVAALFIGLLQPTPVLIIPLFSLLRTFQLLGTSAGIVLPVVARTLPLAVLLLWTWFRHAPEDVLDAARVDGASPVMQFVHIALPIARPALVTVAVWAWISSWNEYLLPTIVSQNGGLQTVPTLLGSYIGAYNTQLGLLAAGTLMASVPSLIAYLVLRRTVARRLFATE